MSKQLNPRTVMSALILTFIVMFCQHADAEVLAQSNDTMQTERMDVVNGKFAIKALDKADNCRVLSPRAIQTANASSAVADLILSKRTTKPAAFDHQLSSIAFAPLGTSNQFELTANAPIVSLAVR